MPQQNTFTIYNASAGSGKTYTLVMAYLLLLFRSKSPERFKRILAITFTNKAVAEMKTRIVETLKQFSETEVFANENPMFNDICKILGLTPEALQNKSGQILNSILHNYAAFDISTIDGFTHRIIRTFAYDLKLPLNFEVELDQDALLTEAVDSLIAKAGTDKLLTKVLVDFAIEKADDDKSWDLSFDFNKIAKLLVNENDIKHIETLKHKTFADFNNLKKLLKAEIKQTESSITNTAQSVLDTIAENGLGFSDFSRGTLPNHFKKAAELEFYRLYDNKLEENIIERKSIYNKTLNSGTASTIDTLLPQIETTFKTVKKLVFHHKFLSAFYRNITPLSVLNAINQELKALKTEQNKMLISEFNSIISHEIKNQPTPFIYERLGEKFKHYFIDEFQDTSVLQWENLIPLLDNSLSGENGSAMLVGDAKQAIYRWRGGKAEQFIGLCQNDNPFHIKKQVEQLPKNYRSFMEVVNFNNQLFKFLSEGVFSNPTYAHLYQNAPQFINKDSGGYVELSFLDLDKDNDRDELYCQAVLSTIEKCLDNGFKLGDICILTRKRREGVAVAEFLSHNTIDIVSSETLLIANAPEVSFINHVLRLIVQPHNYENKIAVLNYLATLFNIENKHDFFTTYLNTSLTHLFKSLERYNIAINHEALLQLSLYDLAETIVRQFKLVKTSNAYVQFYLDVVLDFSHKKGADISGFLEYFDKKKDTLSIVSPQGQDAVQIMTIHKSKGLEFPVVIFPYADLDIYREREPKAWFPLDANIYSGFSNTLLNFNKDFEHFGEVGLDIFNTHKSEQELDNINLLYVALTRAEEHLYIISKKDISAKGEINTNTYAGLLISYLKHLQQWAEPKLIYEFGNQTRTSKPKQETSSTLFQTEFISTAKEDHNIKVVTKSGMLWDTVQEEAIEKGNLVHNIMAKIINENDVAPAINLFIENAIINKEQGHVLKTLITNMVNLPELKPFFSPANTVYTERDIITKEGEIYRPDRIVIAPDGRNVSLLDYKTGAENPKHEKQLQQYQKILEGMGYHIDNKTLVYVNKTLEIKQI
ncbi:MAG: UvrD-helicase domain-containing protein [Flavobacteriaceae bacterium]